LPWALIRPEIASVLGARSKGDILDCLQFEAINMRKCMRILKGKENSERTSYWVGNNVRDLFRTTARKVSYVFYLSRCFEVEGSAPLS